MKKLFSTLLIVFLMAPMIWAQGILLNVNGHVTDDVTGTPIQNHLVVVSVMGGGVLLDYEFYTDNTGYYQSDSIYADSLALVIATTYDCIGEEHSQEEYINPGNYTIVFDFAICGDSIPPTDCENSFWFETMDNLTFDFMGESVPMPADAYLWDFGDGATASGQQASHTYNATNGEFYTVSLTTFSFDPAAGDSCMATSTQEVWAGNGGGGDCDAAFSWEYDTVPAGPYAIIFTDESIGNPAFWMWDFGDGEFSEEQNPGHTYYEEGVYMVCLTIMSDSANSCYDTYCEEIVIGNGGGGNDCESWFAYEVLANDFVHFYGFSSPGEVDTYDWDFGDGSYGTGQEVEHQFDPNLGDMFTVTLTTTVVLDSIGETCTATSTQEVWVFNNGGGDCENWFWYDTWDNLTFDFSGESYPMAADYYSWDFGDGATANGPEVEHTFDPANGEIQMVTLATSSFDPVSGDSCMAVSMQEVYVGDGSGNDCENSFWYESDSSFTFDFYGEAIPVPADIYMWEFGDGTTATGQEVSHSFDPNQGNEFTVCLTTFSSDPAMGDSCYAVSCQDLTIGGQMGQEISGTVSMGGAPADFALVGLFGMGDDGSFIYEFTMSVPGTGFYFFDNVPDGEYYIMASLTPQSPEFTAYFPTYYGDALFWFDAELVSLGEAVNPYDIHLLDVEGSSAGPGTIDGTVTIGTEKGGAAENITVLLMDADENALNYVLSNNEGVFDFSGLEFGTYKLKIEVPGVTSEIATVILNDENQSMDLSFVLKGSSAYLSVGDRNAIVNMVGDIYPNPVAGNAKMEIGLLRPSGVNLTIYNQMGQSVYAVDMGLQAGTQLIDLKTSDLPQGVYTVNLTDDNGKTMRKKFVKIK